MVRTGGTLYDELSFRGISQRFRGHGARCAGGQFRLRQRYERGIIRHDVDRLPIPLGDVARFMFMLDRLMGDACSEVTVCLPSSGDTGNVFNGIAGMWEELISEVGL